jgi:malonyl-CoA decarboxylase
VHPMSTLEQLKPRLDPATRRCFVYMHPSLPEVPLVVLHTALVTQVPHSMPEILGTSPDQPADQLGVQGRSTADSSGAGAGSSSSSGGQQPPSVACFYSISSTQPGLSGVDLGTNLIKTVARQLQRELPSINCLVTLSPLPGFRAWLHTRLQQQLRKEGHHGTPQQQRERGEGGQQGDGSSWDPGLQLLNAADSQLLANCWRALSQCEAYLVEHARQPGPSASPAQQLQALLEQDAWRHLPAPLQQEVGERLLLRLAAVYLLQEKRRGLALDPVANFHLRNGAAVWRLCWR